MPISWRSSTLLIQNKAIDISADGSLHKTGRLSRKYIMTSSQLTAGCRGR